MLFINPSAGSAGSGGAGLLYSQPASIAGAPSTSEQVLNTFTLPAGALAGNGDVIKVTLSFTKSDQNELLTWRIRMGTAGTSADLQVMSRGSTGKSISSIFWFRRLSDTSIQLLGSADDAGSYGGNTNNTPPTPYTVPSLSSALKISLSCQMGGATETPTLQSFFVQKLV